MPEATNLDDAYVPHATGPIQQADLVAIAHAIPSGAPPASIAGSGNWKSGVIYANGYSKLTTAVTLSQAGTLKVTRYLDALGTIVRDVTSQTLVASTQMIIDLIDGKPFQAFQVEIDNTSGSSGAVSGFSLLLTAM